MGVVLVIWLIRIRRTYDHPSHSTLLKYLYLLKLSTDTVITTPISHVGHHVMSLASHWLILPHTHLSLVSLRCIWPLIGHLKPDHSSDWLLGSCLGDTGVMCVMSMLSPRRCQVRYVINDTHTVTTTPGHSLNKRQHLQQHHVIIPCLMFIVV